MVDNIKNGLLKGKNMTISHTAGGNVNAWCSKCKLELAHTIVAMVDNLPKKVKCNTCNGLHNFRNKPVAKKGTKATSAGKKMKSKTGNFDDYITMLSKYDQSKAKKYNITGNFEKDEIIDHQKFGIGIVLSVIQKNKIEIFFKEVKVPKLFIQNR